MPKSEPEMVDGVYKTPIRSTKDTSRALQEVWLSRVKWIPPLTDDLIGFDEDD